MKKWTCFVWICWLALLLIACGKTETPARPTSESTTAETVEDETSLTAFRREMKPPVMAVAWLGYNSSMPLNDLISGLENDYPQWLEKHAFIRDIPARRIIGTEGNLICVVPQDPMATVAVNRVSTDGNPPYEVEEVLYRSESGEPILVFFETGEHQAVTVKVLNEDGRGAEYSPDWDTIIQVFPDDTYSGSLIMDFTPVMEKSTRQLYAEQGWISPEYSDLLDTLWISDYGYALELMDGQDGHSGTARLYEYDETLLLNHTGTWEYDGDGNLHLSLAPVLPDGQYVNADFPVLKAPSGYDYLWIGRNDAGEALPYFWNGLEGDDLRLYEESFDTESAPVRQDWRIPQVQELEDSFWLSLETGYALELSGDSVPGNNGGLAAIYDVGSIGEYTKSYSGSWQLEGERIYLSLVPETDGGVMVDDSFPILIRREELWIGRNGNGVALPHFASDQMIDILEQPKG